jgi:adenylosuccinate synthase
MKELEARNIKIGQRLIIDPRCSLITPEHIERDLQIEQALGARKIGTTLRGIGPAFTDRTSRVGLRLGAAIESFTRGEDLGFSEEYTQKSIKLKPYLGDVSLILHRMLKEGKSVLAEGGQGTMLDLGLGTYPYVTASNTIAASAPTNLGLGPKCVDKVIGVLKAYVTRVGAGPFPTEMSEKQAEKIRRVGDEFGATTGRARRCGWFDGVVAKFAARVNGVEKWAVTKLDVLDGMEKIEVAVAYEIDGERTDDFPTDCEMLNRIKPIYQEFSGWNKSTREARKLADLPKEARAYLDFIAEFTNVELGIISVGYERKCMIIL